MGLGEYCDPHTASSVCLILLCGKGLGREGVLFCDGGGEHNVVVKLQCQLGPTCKIWGAGSKMHVSQYYMIL